MKLPSDNPVRVIECLKSLGLTKYEALVYIALLKMASATASEIHEISDVPRASVYPVIDQLLDFARDAARADPKTAWSFLEKLSQAVSADRLGASSAGRLADLRKQLQPATQSANGSTGG